jgi:hypothetical protein
MMTVKTLVVGVGLIGNVYPHSVPLTEFTHRLTVAFDDVLQVIFGLNGWPGRIPRKTKFA